MARKKLSRAAKIRNYVEKHPTASPTAVAEKFGSHVSEVYKARKTVQQGRPMTTKPAKKIMISNRAAPITVTKFPLPESTQERLSPGAWLNLKEDIETLKRIGLQRCRELLDVISVVKD